MIHCGGVGIKRDGEEVPRRDEKREQAVEKIGVEVFRQGDMKLIVKAPGMAEEPLILIVPETIADAEEVLADKEVTPSWVEGEGGELSYEWRTEGKVEFSAKVTPGEDTVDAAYAIRNISSRTFRNLFVFTCLNPGHKPADAPSFREPAVKGPFIRTGGEFRSIHELPPHKGPRPDINFIMSAEVGLAGVPAAHEPFRDHHEITADCGFIASEGGNGYTIGMACGHPLFVFHNREWWCVHACPNIAELGPGEEKNALQRIYITPQGKEEVYKRASREFKFP